MLQFNDLLGEVGRKVDWELQVAVLPATGKLEDKSAHPLHPKVSDIKGRANQNSASSVSGFINKFNTIGKSK